jgi:hypothetical protein
MNLPELLGKIPMLAGYFCDETAEPLKNGSWRRVEHGVVRVLSDNFDPAATSMKQLLGAIAVLKTLRDQIEDAVTGLEDQFEIEDDELLHAQAALAEIRENGTIPWEQVKEAVGINQPSYIVDGYDMRASILREGQLRYFTPWQIKCSPGIGKLLNGSTFVCHKCALTHDLVSEGAVEVYPVNVIPYSQNCHDCGETIVKGWDCQLFAPKSDAWVAIRLNPEGLPSVDLSTMHPDWPGALLEAEIADEACPERAALEPVIGVCRHEEMV